MSNLAIDLRVQTGLQEFGDILEGEGTLRVRGASGCYPAQAAVSCLVAPAPGDRVLMVVESPQRAFVLAVLERRPGVALHICTSGDLHLESAAGAVHVRGAAGLALASGGAIEVRAPEAEITFGRLSLSAAALSACVEAARVVGDTLDQVFARCTQRVRHSLRRVEELDQVKAGQIDYAASDTLSLHGANLLASAKSLVKVDADQIHLG